MISRDLLITLFQTAEMRRWNDKLCPVPITELDKQGHKMAIAYVLGKFAEHRSDFAWTEVIEGGLFEYFERLTLTDLKPQVFEAIKADTEMFDELKKEVYARFSPLIANFDGLDARFRSYLFRPKMTSSRRVLEAAHYYATKWEFAIVERENQDDYEIVEIGRHLQERQRALHDVEGLSKLTLFSTYRSFVDLCGRLRFQVRWGQLHRVPRTSVLGHMLIVAMLAYLSSLELDACPKRCVNNYFAGLFHDLPEALTKDIVSPVKKAATGMDRFVKNLERDEMERRIYRPKLIPEAWHPEMRLFTEDEFISKVTVEGRVQQTTSAAINDSYNEDRFNPVDGELVKAADDLAAFIEAYLALQNGIANPQFSAAARAIKDVYRASPVIAGINFKNVYDSFGGNGLSSLTT